MCGIAGFWGEVGQTEDAAAILARMTRAVAHRGPDGLDYWRDQRVGLGHARLAIIDLSTGDQPMWDAHRRRVIVFNGEIYNYRELRAALEQRGYHFLTNSDTEVIAAALDAYGIDDGLLALRGMFAFALYDTTDGSLLLARDRVGIKPLFLARTALGVFFGSEPKAVLASGCVPIRANSAALHDYLSQGHTITPMTCFQDIEQLPPGSWLRLSPEGERHGTYYTWQPAVEPQLDSAGAIERAEETLQEALKGHLIADVPIGMFLSGGIDSSLIAALLAGGLKPDIQAFTMGFDDAAYDESAQAREIAESCRIALHETQMSLGAERLETFQRVVNQYDEPFGDSSALPTYLVCREIRKHVTVALSGDGGDEVFGGYVRYRLARRLSQWGAAVSGGRILNPVMGVVRHMGRRGHQAAKAWRLAGLSRPALFAALTEYFTEDERLSGYTAELGRMVRAGGTTAQRMTPFVSMAGDPITALIESEMRLRLHADYLRKVDVASGAHGLEVRVPYLDNEMLRLGAALPAALKVSPQGTLKVVTRGLAAKLLPESVSKRKKQGFSVPLDRWIVGDLREYVRDLILSTASPLREMFQSTFLQTAWDRFEGVVVGEAVSRYQSFQRVYMLASLAMWLGRFKVSVGG
ncbi:MAG TPA: asparagine synthase (glutamine-hydrolyzing) [Aggregatilineales bacterium]|nr:asparagine synthase (glutamine-hydrolyzing) [Anaerolineales bacterium]HRE47868.1 asparagine synthase (glutamine-hydrolyzing) [Aggregatilineales bacterium]